MPYSTVLEHPHPLQPKLGVIEGFFGKGWSWYARRRYAQWLPRHGYGFYIYAPKEDACLRKQWHSPWSEATLQELKLLAAECRANGLAFGIGLSPMGAHHDYARQRPLLEAKVRLIDDELAPDILAVLFDDMKSDTPDLAACQLTIAHDIASWTRAPRLLLCPSYYSTDPILEKVFGPMPQGYLTELGLHLDPNFDIFWTGPKVMSKSYPSDHLAQVTDWLKRKPFLWDNYPVNDGSKSSAFLNLSAFEERPARLAQELSGHAVNPMKQAALSTIPLATLPMSYRLGDHYHPDKAFHASVQSSCGPQLAPLIEEDLALMQAVGLNQLTPEQHQQLQTRYQAYRGQVCADEILGWLAGEYQFDPDCLTD